MADKYESKYTGAQIDSGIDDVATLKARLAIIEQDILDPYNITLENSTESLFISIVEGATAKLNFSYSSVNDNGKNDGNGVGVIYVNSVRRARFDVKQGDNEVDIPSDYLSPGENAVKIEVANRVGRKEEINYVIDVVTLRIVTTFDLFTECNGENKTFYYTPYGEGNKTIHFLMDENELPGSPVNVSSTGRSQEFVIPAGVLTHGAHTFTVYAEVESGGVTISTDKFVIKKDNEEYAVDALCMLSVVDTTPILGYLFHKTEAIEGETLIIPYYAYDPASQSADVVLSVIDENGEVYLTKTETVGRSQTTWPVQDYPAGNIIFRLTFGGIDYDIPMTVADGDARIQTVTNGLVFKFDAKNKTNKVENPAQWSYGNVEASFSGVGFNDADGWLPDADGNMMLRLLPGASVAIPFKLFQTDKRDNGVTVEVEMATHNVRDYDSIVMRCLSSGRGFRIASQYAQLNSEQSEISMQFKEDERVRVSFVVEPKNLNRLIYVYVDGIMCGAIQYPSDDNFAQSPAAGITIGAQSSGIDVYRIYMYDKGLSRAEILDNYIADRPTLTERVAAYERNDVLVNEEINIEKLKTQMPTLPYMIISCAELPQYKDDKKTCDITYVDASDAAKNFSASGAQIDVQGTSSAGYKKKNFKFTLKNGLTYTANGMTSDAYALRDTSIPVDTFCMKADVASSEGANNVELVRLYNDICVEQKYFPYDQEESTNVRVGIDGLPCVIFWHNTATNTTKFWGKYNFNNDKSTPEVFGLGRGCESWEIRNNTSDRVIFKVSDFGSDWENDFEARYPDKNTNITNLKRLTDWLVETDRSAVTSEEEKAERLAKFKDEFEQYFVKEPILFYYIFTEAFLMVDNRAKNFFPTTYDGKHWMPLPYDFDTAIGINNEGKLAFGYSLEDTDVVNGNKVYNGQDSVLWCNVRDAFADDIKQMYANLRSGAIFNYDTIVKRFRDHQDVWCESIWNEDAYEKYLEPLVADNDSSYLTMLQGNKASQREWWLFNRFRYLDSKYQCGDANKNFITLRCYANGNITLIPYSDIYPRVKYGSYVDTERGERNKETTLYCPSENNLNDTETYIYSADRLSDVGDLSPLHVGYAKFESAVKLQKLKLGDKASNYQNTHLDYLDVGNNDLIKELDIRNCVNLMQTVDLSECESIETIYAGGSAITGVKLPVGGKLKILELPGTITNLTLRDQKHLKTLTLAGYSNITTLRVENTPNIPIETILSEAPLDRVRLIGMDMTFDDATALKKIMSCGGMNENEGNEAKAVITGKAHIVSLTPTEYDELQTYYTELDITYDTFFSPVVQLVEGTIAGTYYNDAVTTVGEYALYNCVNLEGIDFPNATSVETHAFSGCSRLSTVNLPSVTTIYAYAFTQNSMITRLDLPNVTDINSLAIQYLYKLSAVVLGGDGVCASTNRNFGTARPISNCDPYIYVPDGLVDAYKEDSVWSQYASKIKSYTELEVE